MHYPFWYVPGLTSPMWIAVVAVIHVYSAMYAVGGSAILAYQTSKAHKLGDKAWLEYLRNHTWFFVLFTVVYGALTGVGIWWTIGLASPLATEDLIHVFVLPWAMEYVSFIIEIVAGFIFFYYWGKLDKKTHSTIGWIYAGAAFMSLFIITPITAFQLNNAGWTPQQGLYSAFFNPQALPQVLSRTGGSILLGALYFFLHSTLKERDIKLRELVGKNAANWAMAGAVLTIAGGIAWYMALPPSGNAALVGAAVLNVLMFIIFALTAGVVLMMYVGPIRNPSWLTPGFAILFFGLGLAATGTGEFIREAVRKPYIVYGRILGNQIRQEEISHLKQVGYLEGGTWTKAHVLDKFPNVATNGTIDGNKMLALPLAQRQEIGKTVFQYHCNNCHAVDGYSAVAQLTRGWNRGMIKDMVIHLEKVRLFMPPWSGTDAEAEVLTDYILSVRHPYPPMPGISSKGVAR